MAIITVGTGGDYAAIQAAITASSNGDEIRVNKAGGPYLSDGEFVVDYGAKDITVRGTDLNFGSLVYGSDRPVIDGQDARKCVAAYNGQVASVVGHFIVQNGYVIAPDAGTPVGGSGILAYNAALAIRYCKVDGCEALCSAAGGGGSGIFLGALGGTLTSTIEDSEVVNCITGNWGSGAGGGLGGGIFVFSGVDVAFNAVIKRTLVKDCIYNDHYMGGAGIMSNTAGSLTLEDVRIEGCQITQASPSSNSYGTGLYVYGRTSVSAKNLLVVGCDSPVGDAAGWGAIALVEMLGDRTIALDHVTVADNSTLAQAGGIFYSESPVDPGCNATIRNSIIQGNSADEADDILVNRGTLNISHSNVHPEADTTEIKVVIGATYNRTDCINANPSFVGSGDNPYDIAANDPGRNRGTAIAGLDHDILGRPRPVATVFDMGAYEYQASSKLFRCRLFPQTDVF